MKIRLRFTIILTISYIIVMLILMLGWSFLGTNIFARRIRNNTEDLYYKELRLIDQNYIQNFYKDSISFTDLKTELSNLNDYMGARFIIANSDGTVIYDTEGETPDNVNLFEYKNDILSHTYNESVKLPDYIDSSFVSVSYPIIYSMELRGYIVALRYSSDIYNEAGMQNRAFLPVIIAVAVIITILYILIYIMIALPLRKVIKASMEYSNRNFGYECNFRHNSDFKRLYDALKIIADDLNNLENYQKKFISNISHDFRSPLTSIRGYTDAMIDGTIPPELHEKYLKIILFETERLTKLTDNLLELGNFDNRGKVLLDISDFNINGVIKHTVDMFEGTCIQKHIRMKLVFEENETYVTADMGKIQQVVYNLVDNAVKFSPPNSYITISTTIKNDKVFVSVKDNGEGIPSENINKIWERFYKNDSSRGKDKKGTGLGLSIVKEIITSHGENINVISTEGVGTEFIFSLPRKPV